MDAHIGEIPKGPAPSHGEPIQPGVPKPDYLSQNTAPLPTIKVDLPPDQAHLANMKAFMDSKGITTEALIPKQLQEQLDKRQREGDHSLDEHKDEHVDDRKHATSPAEIDHDLRVHVDKPSSAVPKESVDSRYKDMLHERVTAYTELGPIEHRDLGTPAIAAVTGSREAILGLMNHVADPLLGPLKSAGLSALAIVTGRFLGRRAFGERFDNAARLTVSINNKNKGFWGKLHSVVMLPSRFLANRFILQNNEVKDVLKYSGEKGEKRLADTSVKKKIQLLGKAAAADVFRQSVDDMSNPGAIEWGMNKKHIEKFEEASKVGERIYSELQKEAVKDPKIQKEIEEKLPDLIKGHERWWYAQGVLGLAVGSSLPAFAVAFGWQALTGAATGYVSAAVNAASGLLGQAGSFLNGIGSGVWQQVENGWNALTGAGGPLANVSANAQQGIDTIRQNLDPLLQNAQTQAHNLWTNIENFVGIKHTAADQVVPPDDLTKFDLKNRDLPLHRVDSANFPGKMKDEAWSFPQ